jgi:protein phosphatase
MIGSLNPLRLGKNALNQFTRPFRYVASLPQRYLGVNVKLPKWVPFQSKSPAAAKSDEDEKKPSKGRVRRSSRTRVAQRAQYSQIHLIHMPTGERTVLHIGTIIGSSTSEITLQRPDFKPVRFQFAQVNPEQYGAHMVLNYTAGVSRVKVDGKELVTTLPIRNQTRIHIDNQEYALELFAWDRTPVITRVDAGWATIAGPVRDHNEDAIGIYQHRDAYMFAVADGVGGGEGGERMSEFAIKYLLAVFNKNVKYNLRWPDVFLKAFQYINAEVRYFVSRSAFPGGTTLTTVAIKDWDAHVAHAGDSRLYHYHQGALRQVTVDHAKQVAVEMETRKAAQLEKPAPMRDVLTKAIGKNDVIEPDIFTIRLQPGDKLVLCTDGLTKLVKDFEIEDMITTRPAEQAADGLVRLANERNSDDNVTVVVIDVLEQPFLEDSWRATAEERVYVGYSPLWSLKLKKPHELKTKHPVFTRRGCFAIVGLLLVGGLFWGVTRLAAQREAEYNALLTLTAAVISPTPTHTETPLPTTTPSRTPSPTFDFRRTATATPSLPPTITPTPIPPTSTLRPPRRAG